MTEYQKIDPPHPPLPGDRVTIPTPTPKKKGAGRTWGLLLTGATALVVGLVLGYTSAPSTVPTASTSDSVEQAEPEVITETETIEVVDETCQYVASELHDMLGVAVNDGLIPYSEVTNTLIEQMMYGADVATIDSLTVKVNNVADTAAGLTTRIEDITADYQKCMG